MRHLFTAVLAICHLFACSLAQAEQAALKGDLAAVYQKALKQDPRVYIAVQELRLSKARNRGARAQLMPQASLAANLSDNRVDYDEPFIRTTPSSNPFLPNRETVAREEYDGKRYSAVVRQMLFNWSTIAAKRRAKQQLKQAEAALSDVMSMMLVDVAERYFQVLLADSNLALTKDELELVEQQRLQVQTMHDRQLVPVTNLLEAQARADQVRVNLIEAENQAALTRESLTEIIGVPVGALTGMKESFTLPKLEQGLAYWEAAAAANNSRWEASRKATAAAKAGLQEQRGALYPSISLVYSHQVSDLGFDNQQYNERETRYVAADISMPFLQGSSYARVSEAKALYHIALAQQAATRREVLRRTREAWLSSRSSRQRIDAAAASVASFTKTYDAMSKGFSLGTVTATDVLEALADKTRAERDYQTALYRYLVTWLALHREGGLLESSHLDQVNSLLLTR